MRSSHSNAACVSTKMLPRSSEWHFKRLLDELQWRCEHHRYVMLWGATVNPLCCVKLRVCGLWRSPVVSLVLNNTVQSFINLQASPNKCVNLRGRGLSGDTWRLTVSNRSKYLNPGLLFFYFFFTCSWCWTQPFSERNILAFDPQLHQTETMINRNWQPCFWSSTTTAWSTSRSPGVVGVRGLLRGHVCDGNEGGASAAFATSPKYIYPTTPGDLTGNRLACESSLELGSWG